MTRLAVLAGLGSLALLLGALAFQHLGGLAPCEMCIWQRWPHGLAAGVALAVVIAWLTGAAHGVYVALCGLGAALMTASAGLGLFHAGVEWKWWEGITACATEQAAGLSAEDLLATIEAAPVVRCDEAPWEFLNLSMAGWNGVMSVVLLGLWLFALFTAEEGFEA